MNRKAYASMFALIFLALAFLASCSSSSTTTTTPPVVAISATSGTPQNAGVGTAFGAPLVATVTSGGSPASGVSVTFTAPANGASGTFTTSSAATETDTTNASGVATSSVFTANTTAGAYTVTASATGASNPANFSLTNTAGAAATINATSGTPQSTTVSTAFAAPLVATVLDSDSNPVSGVAVTFTAPASGASGLFTSNSTTTETDTTNASGVATSSAFTANAIVGGPYNVIATSGALTPVNFVLTNTAVVVVSSNNYAFYVSGLDVGFEDDGPNYYAIAGSVTIDSNGNVLGGEQEYNDAFGITSPTGGDTIMPGTTALVVDSTTGQGTLTLTTNNSAVGVSGVETFAIQFVNANHALLTQFDGSATSSGSLDLQTLSGTLNDGNYSFTLSGVDSDYFSIVYGGVFTVSNTGTTLAGTFDVDDFGAPSTTPTLGTPFTGTITGPDSFGWGTITSAALGISLNYYVVGPEAIRIIDVDEFDSAVGSAFGQGTGTFSKASLGTSVFTDASNSWGALYGAAGMFTTTPGSGTFTGFGDDDEGGSVVSGAIAGTYSIAGNGYGSLTITGGDLQTVSVLGVYMTDPTLNLTDPNNTTSGLGGALVADLDGFEINGTGVVTPQTDTTTTDFAGTYAFGAQNYNGFNLNSFGWEIDFVGLGTVTGGVLSGTGSVSDPFFTLDSGNGNAFYSGVTFAETAVADGSNPGRYTVGTLAATLSGAGTQDFSVAIYQASGTQLYWIEEDGDGGFLGPLEQQGSLTGMPAARKPAAKTQPKQK
jgi:hypothetical protein